MRPLHPKHLWDGVIAASLALFAIGAGFAGAAVTNGTASTWQIAAGIACIAALAIVIYGSWIEPRRIAERRLRLPFPIPGLRIAIVADIHVGHFAFAPFVARLVERINATKPDIILLPGDFLSDSETDIADLEPLRHLSARHGTFAVIGNHDSGHYINIRQRPWNGADRSAELSDFLEKRAITVLRNRSVTIHAGGRDIVIAGIDDLWPTVPAAVPPFLASLDPALPTILVSHHPDAIELADARRAHLIVSGHTHGGQIRLPIIGPLLPVPTALGRRFSRGVFRISPTCTLFITHGVGATELRSRLCATPEVVVIETENAE
ncbi:MAG: hypothetical protein G01um101425_425 [Candidatus Peregrinibacteria bacterium Gr01-1014_25]|nr:MAG: hypothetical protein G01um101425_425 [Candidatus Peregrinibacteria bacterium Gr01-1014_25]